MTVHNILLNPKYLPRMAGEARNTKQYQIANPPPADKTKSNWLLFSLKHFEI